MNIFIPGVPSNSNAQSQWARFKTAKERKHFRSLAAGIALDAMIAAQWEPLPFTIITARHVSPYRRRRDPLGLAERLKGIVDGLVDAGVLPDDDENHIEVILARSIKGEVAGIHLTLEAPNE